MRWIVRLLVLILLLAGLQSIWSNFRAGNWVPDWLSSTEKSETTHALVLQEISAMGKLELVKYNFKDVVEQQITKMWLPNAKAILIVQGEAIGCIDLTKVEIADITSEAETLVVNMPEPELCVFKIDHSKSRVYNTEYAFNEEAKLVQEAYKQAEKQIQRSALDMGILEQTQINARKILTPVLEKASGKKVILKFPLNAKIEKLR
ncbi:DUF4230 domain-containing protein [Dyadobacter fanqingshengii]|uniref:DUF4230 domain-containing protein n=1 Tax=Dyadobacter fanqingshengii TaxID=2906443 RepID=A0A9X1P9G1_9BACT|nr:DUF4230 domain-containing protein [Dyadobacter fanqingshengii]MCF0039162.1 DUF4230 domain-containing protein [Dyadobacter fanqingshengii]MCF2503297.1 DUF4230 domain-containing protein [Dyadobacter fanqingshengii]USJ34018.1 DUF4230 domain-containing protein [Dyadobacter fanqingshengii]